jgi:two-component system sensor histidine kinase MprB
MTLARRLSLFFTALAVATAAAIGGLAYYATDHSIDTEIKAMLRESALSLLAGQIPDGLPRDNDDNLRGSSEEQESEPEHLPTTSGTWTPAGSDEVRPVRRGPRGSLLLAQEIGSSGKPTGVDGSPARLPVDPVDVQLARSGSEHGELYRIVTVDGTRYLMLTRPHGHARGAVQVARALAERDELLARLAGSIVLITVAVAAAAALAGVFVARRLTRDLVRLTAVAEEVTDTGRLDVEVPTRGRDEVGRLGIAFDTMLGRLAQSREDQQRLVQDAGHELRTPLTSIRTNISLLRRAAELPDAERQAVLDDLTGESRELTSLVNELVELATERRGGEEDVDVDLAEVAERVAARGRRRTGRDVVLDVAADAPVGVRGRPTGLERAVSNLVDNALKFDLDGDRPVEIGMYRGMDGGLRVEVRDRGPGIPAEDLGRVFDRFHRATAVRSLPGSGLGLSIVHDVATTHGGSVFAANRPGGGTVIGFTLPWARLQTASNPH